MVLGKGKDYDAALSFAAQWVGNGENLWEQGASKNPAEANEKKRFHHNQCLCMQPSQSRNFEEPDLFWWFYLVQPRIRRSFCVFAAVGKT